MLGFETGQMIALRETFGGQVWEARAAVVVEDSSEERTLLYVPPKTIKMVARSTAGGELLRIPTEPWDLGEARSSNRHVLSFAWPDRAHGVLMSWDGDSGRFLGWYVNLQTPLRRTAVGFDAVDHVLDVVVSPEGVWRHKDDHELADALAAGLFTEEDADAFRAERERITRAIDDYDEPFDTSWLNWKPAPAWEAAALCDGWDTPPEPQNSPVEAG